MNDRHLGGVKYIEERVTRDVLSDKGFGFPVLPSFRLDTLLDLSNIQVRDTVSDEEHINKE